MSGRWVDLREAAELLGTSTEAVRKRAVGGSLRATRPARAPRRGDAAPGPDNRPANAGQRRPSRQGARARVPELETPQTSEDGTQEPVEDAGRAKRAGAGATAPQNASERVPWWRRVLGEGR